MVPRNRYQNMRAAILPSTPARAGASYRQVHSGPIRAGRDHGRRARPYTARRMLTTVTAGPYTLRGVSVGGVYTSIAVPELGIVFDAGTSPRSTSAMDTILLSHGHADHIGALPAMLGIRA